MKKWICKSAPGGFGREERSSAAPFLVGRFCLYSLVNALREAKRKASAMAFLASRSACRMTWRVKAVQSGLFEMAEVLGISLRMVSPKGSSPA